jgi:hypothetical protein
MKCSSHYNFLQPFACAWLNAGRSKVLGDKIVPPMVVRLMVVRLIIHSWNNIVEILDNEEPKDFPSTNCS